MDIRDLKNRGFESELVFSASRSSGPGGQNVNKVNTKIELRFNLNNSLLLTAEEKEIISGKLAGRINKDGDLIITARKERTQHQNRMLAIEKFFTMILKALEPRAERVPTKPSPASVTKRISEKRTRGHLKQMRKDRGEDQQ